MFTDANKRIDQAIEDLRKAVKADIDASRALCRSGKNDRRCRDVPVQVERRKS